MGGGHFEFKVHSSRWLCFQDGKGSKWQGLGENDKYFQGGRGERSQLPGALLLFSFNPHLMLVPFVQMRKQAQRRHHLSP